MLVWDQHSVSRYNNCRNPPLIGPIRLQSFVTLLSNIYLLLRATFELKRKCLLSGNPGWKCDSGVCIPTEWVCDKEYQCDSDNSDEEEGCKLYPGKMYELSKIQY